MEEMAISKFKAQCLAVLERVRKTKQPILITRFGQPVAQVTPPQPECEAEDWMGSMRGSGEIVGDLTEPTSNHKEWEALRD